MPTSTKDRFTGCLIGQCLGDALGFPVEGFPTEFCERYVLESLTEPWAIAKGRGRYSFGQYTDDSQLARELVQSYVERGRFDPGDYAKRIAAIFAEDRIVGRGRATQEAALRLITGVPWQQAGTPAPSAGNGSAMRAAPIGLFFHDRPEEMIQAAHDQGRITHADPRCSAGSVAIAGCVALALTRPLDTEDCLDQLAEWVGAMDEGFAGHVKQLKDWVALGPRDAVEPISRCGLEPGFRDSWEGISPFVVGSVLWSLYSFFSSPDDYMQTVRTAIAVGGDVDTTAAMAGAISGAYLGLESLPQELTRCLTDQGSWGYPELVDLALRCHAASQARG